MAFESDDEFAAVCPYLGLADDADSHATYATEAHRCYRLPNPTRIATGHQESYCLGANHVSCPVYLGEGVPGAAAPAAAAASVTPPPRMPQRGPAPSTVRGPEPRNAAPAPRQRAGGAPQNGQPGQRPTRRPQNAGTIGPRPRAGGVSMPVATVGLFALAIVVIVLAFAIQHFAGNGGPNLTAAETFATTQAQKATANAGGGTQTQPAGATTATKGTPGATTATNKTPGATTPSGTTAPGGQKTYVVKSGDICSTIAESNGITLQQLEDANGLTDDSCRNLQVGQTLKLP